MENSNSSLLEILVMQLFVHVFHVHASERILAFGLSVYGNCISRGMVQRVHRIAMLQNGLEQWTLQVVLLGTRTKLMGA